MGTIKLNKKIENNGAASAEVGKKLAVNMPTKKIDKQVNTEKNAENIELCELAKQDEGFVEEFKDLRTANETVYRRNDRTLRKIITATPTRYRDENGELKEISNRLIDNGSEIVNEANSFKVKFNKDVNNGRIFDLQKGKKTVSLSAVGTSKARSHACGCKCVLCSGKDNSVTATLNDGTEIEYITMSDRVKENIIVKERQDSYEYNFTLNIGDLAVEEGEHNNLLLKDKETGETQFVIPAPYMYDANGMRSDKVSYEIDVNGEELEIKVVADAEFINADERVFPITIDPQVVVINDNTIDSKLKYYTDFFISDEVVANHYTINNVIKIISTNSENYSQAYVKYSNLELENKIVKQILLELHCSEGSGEVTINGVSYEIEAGQVITVDVTNVNQTNLYPTWDDDNTNCVFYDCGELAPKLIIEYVDEPYLDKQYEGEKLPTIKEFEFTDKAKGLYYVNSGAVATTFKSFDSSDFVLPLNIVHVHKLGLGETNFGLNWRLNLNRKLNVANDDTTKNTRFIYTDELGDKYIFNEKYYYLSGTNKVFVSKDAVTVSISGELFYNNKPVYKYQSCNGNTLISELDDFKNSDLIEQRQDEQIQLEEYIRQYEPTLKSYVKVKLNGENNVESYTRLSSLTKSNYDSFVNVISNSSSYLLMTEGEAIQLQSVCSNLKQVDDQLSQIAMQKRQLTFQKNQIAHQITQIGSQLTDAHNTQSLGKRLYSDCASEIKFSEINNKDETEKINKAREQMSYQSAGRTIVALNVSMTDSNTQRELLIEQETSISKQETALNTQKTQLLAQKNLFIKQSRDNLSSVKKTFLDFFAKKAQLDLLLLQIPVNYIKDKNGIISGFNKAGDLVIIGDSYGNAVSIDYDSNKQIASISDSNGKTMIFNYADGKLISISDNCGRTVKYIYDSKKLKKVIFADNSSITFVYQSNLVRTIDSSDELQVKLSYDEARRIQEIKNWSPRITIGEDIVKEKDSCTEKITVWTMSYSDKVTTIRDINDASETYRFDASERIIEYETYDMKRNREATTYSYVNSNGKQITAVKRFNDDVETSIKKYNVLDLLISEISDWQNISDTVRVKTEKQYEYDINNQLTSEIVVKFTEIDGIEKQVKYHTNYSYNAKGSLTLTESYIEGEEFTSGINYEQRVYDDNGNAIKTIKWNSLDSSSKFYTESRYSENGQLTANLDELGNIFEEYEYNNGTNIVNSVKYANGSKFAYGRNPYNYQINSITQSTKNGEENTTDLVYKCGLPVSVKSGNTVIDYVYNAERQKAKVKVNGITQIESTYYGYNYCYDDETANFPNKTDKYIEDETHSYEFVYDDFGVNDDDTGLLLQRQSLTVNQEQLYYKYYNIHGLIDSVTYKDTVQKQIQYSYDDYKVLQEAVIKQGSEIILTESYSYDAENVITQKSYTGAVTQTYSYTYKDNSARDLDYISFGDYKFKPLTDVNGRNTGKEIYNGANKIAGEYITYRKVGDHATNMPATVWFGNGSQIKDSIKYKYDSCGNICAITENGHTFVKYTYDSLNRLIREDNKLAGSTIVFAYDNAGNITERCVYDYTSKNGEELSELNCSHYSYDYDGDKLINYNGETFAYNNLGNPTVYRGKAATWQYGKYLTKLGETTFAYDGLGRRTGKNAITFTYDSDGRLLKQSNGLEFAYDNAGLIGIKHNEAQYFYRKDAQGNIVALLDSNGNVVVKYVYDAWGNNAVTDKDGNEITAKDHIGNLNPFRYRGYYYDTETELYFLQTRYYDPELDRFISQDSLDYADPETINGLNLYAYCCNNPVMAIDPTGTKLQWWHKLLIGIAFIVVGAAVTALTAGAGTGFLAAFGSALLSSAIQVGISTAISAGVGMIIGGITTGTWQGALNGLFNGAADGFMWGGIFAGGAQIISGGFKVAANLGVATGRNGGIQLTKNLKILSPNNVKFYENGGTLLKIGKNFRLDVGAKTMLHMHMLGAEHIPIGTILASFLGSYKSLWQK